MTKVQLVKFGHEHAAGVSDVCKVLKWPSYVDSEVASRAFSAPGVSTIVAIVGDQVVGFAEVFSDGIVHGHLALVGVLPAFRRQGIAKSVVREAFAISGAQRLDLVTDGADDFYASFAHQQMSGYRIYPSIED